MIRFALTAVALAFCGLAAAKIPPPVLDDAAKAKAAEAAAKTAWQGKVDAYQLCKSQDRVAAYYLKKGNAGAKDAKAVKTAAAAPTPAAAASGSAAPAIPACTDPGAFAFAPPAAKPLEAAGAHSPATTAAAPPSGKATSAAIAPAQAATAQSKKP